MLERNTEDLIPRFTHLVTFICYLDDSVHPCEAYLIRHEKDVQ